MDFGFIPAPVISNFIDYHFRIMDIELGSCPTPNNEVEIDFGAIAV